MTNILKLGRTMALAGMAALALAGQAGAQEVSRLSATDGSGAIYFATSRYSDRTEYMHLTKMDPNGNLLWEEDYFLSEVTVKPVGMTLTPAGVALLVKREVNRTDAFALIAYSPKGNRMWERIFSDNSSNVPVAVASDRDGFIYVCGTSKNSYGRYIARLWKFDYSGTLRWDVNYDGGGNTYAQQLQVLFNGDLSMGVTIFSNSGNYGQYENRSVTYDREGRRNN